MLEEVGVVLIIGRRGSFVLVVACPPLIPSRQVPPIVPRPQHPALGIDIPRNTMAYRSAFWALALLAQVGAATVVLVWWELFVS